MSKCTKLMLAIGILLLSLPIFSQGTQSDAYSLVKPLTGSRQVRGNQAVSNFRGPGVVMRSVKRETNSPAVSDSITLWGNMLYSSSWSSSDDYNMSELKLDSVLHINTLASSYRLQAVGGGAYIGDIFHLVSSYSIGSTTYAYTTSFSTTDWKQKSGNRSVDITAVSPSGVCYDKFTNKTYGFFYTSDKKGTTFGTIDYDRQLATVIADCDLNFITFAINGKGKCYSISADGDLYSVNKKTGEVSKIGETGVVPAKGTKDAFYQSMAFDFASDKLYWAAHTADGSAIYLVNTATGAATKVADLPGNEEIVALYVPKKAPSADAPAAVSNLNVNLSGDKHKFATVTFLLPDTTYGGDVIQGNLNYSILANGDTVATGIGAPGESISKGMQVEDGLTVFYVTCSNQAGESEYSTTTVYVGLDTPDAPTDVTLTFDSNTETATLNWNAVDATGVNDGYVDTSNVTYTVTRYPDSVVVAKNISALSFSEQLKPEQMTLYHYGVNATNGTLTGEEGISNTITVGDYFLSPYSESFPTLDNFSLFTVIDSNNDESTWDWYDDGTARYSYNSSMAADDWLISPPIKLEKDHQYTFSFNAKCSMEICPEKIEVAWGQGTEVSTFETLVSETTLTNESYQTFSKTLLPTETALYRFAFHAVSDADENQLYLDDINIDAGSNLLAPDSVTEMGVTAEPTGKLTATISATTPSYNIKGEHITELTKVEFLRADGTMAGIVSNPAVGEVVSVNDTVNTDGVYGYYAVAYNNYGKGLATNVHSIYVGQDVPKEPTDVKLKDNCDGTATLSWKPAEKGQNGGFVDKNTVCYTIYNVEHWQGGIDVIGDSIKSVTGEESCTFAFNDSTGAQSLLYYIIGASNSKGESEKVSSSAIVCGESYTLPFHETCNNGALDNAFWWAHVKGSNYFQLTSFAEDEDNGSFGWLPYDLGDEAWINSGKISMEGAENPQLVFWYYLQPNQNIRLKLELDTPDKNDVAVDSLDFASNSNAKGWYKKVVDLSSYKNEKYIIVKFHGISYTTDNPLYIDNIYVYDAPTTDISAELQVASSAMLGQTDTIVVNAVNCGAVTLSNYDVELYVDGELVGKTHGKGLEPYLGTSAYSYAYTWKPTNQDTVIVKAVVECDNDKNEGNNIATAQIIIHGNGLPVVSDLSASASSDNHALLTWTAPVAEMGKRITEDFESYESFKKDSIGDWMMIDGDATATVEVGNGVDFTHEGEAMAFITFNPTKAGIDLDTYPDFAPHSGDQYLACFSAVAEQAPNNCNDDWLISPELSGEEQTISFWAKTALPTYGKETLEVAYSEGGTDTTEFISVSGIVSVANQWTQYSYQLPNGAKRFAIHVTSPDRFMCMLDDISYSSSEMEALNIIGYHIYRNGVCIDSTYATTNSYRDAAVLTDSARYNVTVLYSKGESALSNTATVVSTGISSVNSENLSEYSAVYTLDGQLVGTHINLKGLPKGVYVVKTGTVARKVTVQ